MLTLALLSASCPIPIPKPKPSPSPSPSPTAPPTPVPSASPVGCPQTCKDDPTFWVGIALLSKVPVDPQGGKWLGYRLNYSATPHTHLEACQDRPGQATEQRKDCQNPDGPDFYMTLKGHFENDPCDKSSTNNYICHHKPEGPNGASGKGAQVGLTKVCAVPQWASPDSPKGRCVVTDVQP